MKSWKAIEALGYTYYLEKGYKVFIPIIELLCCDFIVEKKGKFIRVNVKKAGLKNKKSKNSWSVSISSPRFDDTMEKVKRKIEFLERNIDIYLVYLPFSKSFIELKGDFFIGSNSKSKLIPKDLLPLLK